jgi:hypothetical protein
MGFALLPITANELHHIILLIVIIMKAIVCQYAAASVVARYQMSEIAYYRLCIMHKQ